MKNLPIFIVIVAAVFGFTGCADTGTPTSTAYNSHEGVAGEKVGGGMEDRVGASMTGTTPSAQVKW